jgi:hypothetical protein
MANSNVSIERGIAAVLEFDADIPENTDNLGYLDLYVQENSEELAKYGASYYVLIVGSLPSNSGGDSAGVARLGLSTSYITSFDGGGLEYNTLAHEIGHNDGLVHTVEEEHNFETSGGSTCGEGDNLVASLMSTSSGFRSDHFLSSPSVMHTSTGEGCGVVDTQDVRSYYYEAVETGRLSNPDDLFFSNIVEPVEVNGTVSLRMDSEVFYEDDGTIQGTVIPDGLVGDLSSVQVFVTSKTAQRGLDFNSDDVRIEFNEGVSEYYFSIDILSDDLVEDEEVFEISLRDAVGVEITSSPVEVTIMSDDLPAKGDVEIDGSAEVVEGESTVLTLLRDGGDYGELTVHLIISGDVVEGQDYFISEHTVVFADGEMSKEVEVVALDNDEVDGDRELTITLETNDVDSNVSGQFIVSISDNDEELKPTPEPTPETGSSGGGSFGFVTLLLSLMVFIRRFDAK